MSDSKLHLMSFAPVPDTKTTVHVVGLPDSLRDALFTLMPPRKEGGYLNTKVLKDDLRCWLDRAVELNPVRPNVHTDSWLIALAPIDLAKLCNVIAVWISSRKDIDTQSPAYRKVMGMLHPETFEEAVRGEEICLFSGDGRPTGRLTFPAFSAQVADAIADIPLELANGMVENFSRVSRGNGNVYELISDIHWHKEDPWAFALRFHVETLPVGRKARLNMDVAVRRFIGKPWQDDPFLKHDVNAYVRTEGGTLRVVPYGYDKQKRDLAWDPAALANYEFASGTGLPAVREYLEDMGRYARDGSQPQILSPYAMTASWASKPSVASGASVIDKAMFFEAVAARLKDIAEPVGALDSLQLTHLKASIEEPRQADWDKVPDWFTDEVAAGGADDGTVPNRRDKQGLFKMDGYFLALAPRPGDAQYKWSARGSKYDSPTAAFCEKTINEYCLLSPGGEAEALASVKYAEALRGCMVQLYKNDMRVNLPAPLHLAEQVEEYIWDWGLTGRR